MLENIDIQLASQSNVEAYVMYFPGKSDRRGNQAEEDVSALTPKDPQHPSITWTFKNVTCYRSVPVWVSAFLCPAAWIS